MLSINDLKQRHDLQELAENYKEQNHFGDFLILETMNNGVNYRLWNNHLENQKQGEPKYQLEALLNGKWKTIDTQQR